MSLSPEEIANKQFLITLRGFDKDEVGAFLRRVADDYRALLSKAGNAAAAAKASDGKAVANPYSALGEEIARVLETAQTTAEMLRSKADAESTQRRREADEEISDMRRAVADEVRRVTEQAEKRAAEVRTAAERDANEKLRECARRVQRLQMTEAEVRQRLTSLEGMLQAIRTELGSAPEVESSAAAGADASIAAQPEHDHTVSGT